MDVDHLPLWAKEIVALYEDRMGRPCDKVRDPPDFMNYQLGTIRYKKEGLWVEMWALGSWTEKWFASSNDLNANHREDGPAYVEYTAQGHIDCIKWFLEKEEYEFSDFVNHPDVEFTKELLLWM